MSALAAFPFAAALAGGLREPSWAAGGLFGFWLLAAFGPWRPKSGGPARLWAAWAGWVLLAALAGPEPLVSLPAAARALSAALAFALARAFKPEEDEAWVLCLIGAGLVAGAAALFTGGSALLSGRTAFDSSVSMTGLIPPYYNYTAFLVAAAAAAAFACANAPGACGPARRSWWSACVLLLLPLVLCRSRGGQLGFLLAGGLIVARAGGRKAVLVLAAVAAVGAAAVWPKLGASNQQRPKLWRAAAQTAADRPLLGEGPERFSAGLDRHNFVSGLGVGRYQFSSPRAHSEPLEAAATAGLPAALLWLAAALWPLALAVRAKPGPVAREAALAAAVATTAQLFVDNMLQLPGLALVWASALGVACPPEAERAAPRANWRAAAAAAGLFCLAAYVPAAALKEGSKRLDASTGPAKERLAREALRLSPASADWREALGDALLEQGRTDEAAPELERALALRPLRPFPAVALARGRAAQGRWSDVVDLTGRALAAEPDYLGARLLRAQALLALGRKGEARKELDEATFRRGMLERGGATPGSGYERALLAWDEKAALGLSGKIR